LKLVYFGSPGVEQAGILVEDEILPLWPMLAKEGIGPMSINDLIALWPRLVSLISAKLDAADRFSAAGVRFGPPVPAPRTIVAVGFNYRQHGREIVGNLPFPNSPILFLKPPSSVTGPRDAIIRPPETVQLDYELELGVVMGKPLGPLGRNLG